LTECSKVEMHTSSGKIQLLNRIQWTGTMMLSPVTYYLSRSIYGVKCCVILLPIREIHVFGLDQEAQAFMTFNFFGSASSPPENRQETTHHGYSS
jgi:hypothetical protein